MTPKQQRFIEEYLIDFNATAASVRAGYAPKGASKRSYRLLRNPEIATAIEIAQKARAKKVGVTKAYVLENLLEIVERCMQKAPVMIREGGSEAQSFDKLGRPIWRFNATGAVRALELIGKHIGMFVDQHHVDHVHYAVSAEPDPQTVEEWQARYKTLQ